MNAFFNFAELAKSEFPLKDLSKGFTVDAASSQLDKPLAKDITKNPENVPTENTLAKDSNAENTKVQGKSTESTSDQDGIQKSESTENRELSPDEINEKQRAAIKEALERLARGEELTNEEKGNLCEMMMDQYYTSQGYTPIHSPRVTSLNDKGHQGIDGVYEKDGKYVVADAKFGSAKLKDTQDGTQMSQEWIDRRLDDAVGKEKAGEIRDAYEDDPNSITTEVYHYDPKPDANGDTRSDVYHVNENGEKDGKSNPVETFHNGERADAPPNVTGGETDA